MKQLHSLFIALAALFSFTLAYADTPVGPMNYQGRLLDNNGIPLTGSYNFSASVYDALTGGTLKYSELHNAVSVDDGVYSFLIGTTTKDSGDSTWSVELWNCCTNLYLEIAVNGQALSPRHQLAAAPYAFQANLALTTNNALALGGKSATEYNNILASICVAGKGKWLELVGKCLGAGSSFTGTAVNWNTLSASNNFTGLDLTNADITGINFTGTDFTGTLFKKTNYKVSSMSNTNLTNTVWDGATAIGSVYTVASTTNFTGATMKNMDMSKWNLSLITDEYKMHYFSAAYLSACPAALFNLSYSAWQCKLMHSTGSQYFLAGFYSNYSTTSPATIATNGEVVLDVDPNAFDNTNTAYSKFNGVVITQSFLNGSFYFADLSYATLRNINFTNTNFNGTFVDSIWENIAIGSGISMNNANLTNANLTNVSFQNDLSTPNFTRATLEHVRFELYLGNPDFTDAYLDDTFIHYIHGATTTLNRTHISGNFDIESIDSTDAPNMGFTDVLFSGATLTGSLRDITFTGSFTMKNSVFKNLDLCSTVIPLVDTTAPHDDLSTVSWEGAVECPDGTTVTGSTTLYANTCNYLTRMTPRASDTSFCTTAPGTLQ